MEKSDPFDAGDFPALIFLPFGTTRCPGFEAGLAGGGGGGRFDAPKFSFAAIARRLAAKFGSPDDDGAIPDFAVLLFLLPF